jgi:Protein of unknown function (DUF4007)
VSDLVYRFSGHESFPCRYAWIPKAVEAISANPEIFGDVEEAMVRLGLGKNMVQSLRFWVQAMRVAESAGSGLRITEFGQQVFGAKGLDPYLEDTSTLWLLHWQLCSHNDSPLFAWHFLFNRFHEPDIVRSHVLEAMERESLTVARTLAKATLAQHFDIFMHTYVPTRGAKNEIIEDNLDCPLVELELITPNGQRVNREGKLEAAFCFDREPKPELSNGVFLYAVYDYWKRCKPGEDTLSLSEIATGIGSPGQVFKLPEDEVRSRLAAFNRWEEDFEYRESAMFEQLKRVRSNYTAGELIEFAYDAGAAYV